MARVKLYRIDKPRETAVMHPETGTYIVPDPHAVYRADDPLVLQYPWLFIADEDRIEAVESAEQKPGQKRNLPGPVYEGNI